MNRHRSVRGVYSFHQHRSANAYAPTLGPMQPHYLVIATERTHVLAYRFEACDNVPPSGELRWAPRPRMRLTPVGDIDWNPRSRCEHNGQMLRTRYETGWKSHHGAGLTNVRES